MNNFFFLKRLLYNLKMRYGDAIQVVQVTSDSVDTQTGKKVITRETIDIKKAIVLTATIASKVSQDIQSLKMRPFVYGGQIGLKQRIVIIDGADSGKVSFATDNNNYILFEKKHYQIKDVQELPGKHGFILTTVETNEQ